jgi:hemerythrin-like metal-binding protein
MPLFIWKPSYDTGIPEIDYDHRQLVGLINELYEAMTQNHGYEIVNRILDRLLEYAQHHFATEESFMRAGKYPQIATHEGEHQRFCDEVAAMDAGRRAGKQPLSTEMMSFLCEWLRDHVTTSDKEMGRFLTNPRS